MEVFGAPSRSLMIALDPAARASLSARLEASGMICVSARDEVEALGWILETPCNVLIASVPDTRVERFRLVSLLRESPLLWGSGLIALTDLSADALASRGVKVDVALPATSAPDLVVAEARALADREGSRVIAKGRVVSPEPSRRCELRTTLDVVRPVDVVKALHAARRSARLEVTAPSFKGVVQALSGEITSAYVEEDGQVVARGEPALHLVLTRDRGDLLLELGQSGAHGEGSRVSRKILRPTPRVVADARERTTATPVRRVGDYEVLETLRDTESVVVHRARRDATSRVVRLVVEKRPRDLKLLESIRSLRVPGIARLRAFGALEDGRGWYVTDLPRGPTLEEVVRAGALTIERALAVFEPVLGSLADAHARGIPHGALDARRIVLSPGQRPILMDHGLVPRGSGLGDQASFRATAPEVWRGKKAGPASDLYAVGILLFFALTGRYPFEDELPVVVCQRHLRDVPPTLADAGVPAAGPDLEAILAKLLAKDPADRYPSTEAARALIAVERGRARARSQPSPEVAVAPAPTGYRLLRRLGTGANAHVYEAVHETLEKLCAVKVVRFSAGVQIQDVRERFLREARLAVSLEHPGIVRVFDAREEAGRLFLVMELIEGESLGARIAREGALDESETIRIARAVLVALDHAHTRGVVHRDVKPDNILITADELPKLSDFGLARSLGAHSSISQNVIMGTPYFMSPEQCNGERADARSDLYSFGATIWTMLAGKPPFVASNLVAVLTMHTSSPLPDLRALAPGVSTATVEFVGRLLEKDRAARFQTAREALAALPPPPSGGFELPDITPRR